MKITLFVLLTYMSFGIISQKEYSDTLYIDSLNKENIHLLSFGPEHIEFTKPNSENVVFMDLKSVEKVVTHNGSVIQKSNLITKKYLSLIHI